MDVVASTVRSSLPAPCFDHGGSSRTLDEVNGAEAGHTRQVISREPQQRVAHASANITFMLAVPIRHDTFPSGVSTDSASASLITSLSRSGSRSSWARRRASVALSEAGAPQTTTRVAGVLMECLCVRCIDRGMQKGHVVEHSTPNAYSDTWFDLFLADQDADQTAREIAFLTTILPSRVGARVLDVCCGYGRHAMPLAGKGYTVLGIDRHPEVIRRAQRRCDLPNATFTAHDMTRLDELPEDFDAVICMWQSFGYFDASTNRRVLASMANRLRSGGRLVLDIYNRDFFVDRQEVRTTTIHDTKVTTRQRLDGGRLIVELDYQGRSERDVFDWQVFTVDAMRELAGHVELILRVACSGFDASVAASDGTPRMQLAFAKR